MLGRASWGAQMNKPTTSLSAIVRTLAAVLWLLPAGACAAAAADDGPHPPCAGAALPAFAEPGAPPNVRAWRGRAAETWVPPACTGWSPAEADILVALAGSFRYDGDMEGLRARVGAISAKKGMRYWSTTEKNWQPLLTDAYALTGPDAAARRADFKPAELAEGRSLDYAQSDNRSAGINVYREHVLRADHDRLWWNSENVTPVKKLLVTLFEPGGLQNFYVIERRGPGQWNFYSLTRAHKASSMLPLGGEAPYINRSAAFFRYLAAIPSDQEPPAAR